MLYNGGVSLYSLFFKELKRLLGIQQSFIKNFR